MIGRAREDFSFWLLPEEPTTAQAQATTQIISFAYLRWLQWSFWTMSSFTLIHGHHSQFKVARGVRHGTVSLAREEEEASRTAVAEGPELADTVPVKLQWLGWEVRPLGGLIAVVWRVFATPTPCLTWCHSDRCFPSGFGAPVTPLSWNQTIAAIRFLDVSPDLWTEF
jgi:hypothetical protein